MYGYIGRSTARKILKKIGGRRSCSSELFREAARWKGPLEDRRPGIVIRAIAENPAMSDRAIAAEIGVGKDTVRRARNATGADAPVATRTGRDGKSYPARPKQGAGVLRRRPLQNAHHLDSRLGPVAARRLDAEIVEPGCNGPQ